MEIVQFGPLTVVGSKVTADWKGLWVEMPKAWRAFLARRNEIKHRASDRFVDISLSEEEGEYNQLIGAEVSAVEDIPADMIAVEIPAQKYVHEHHMGPAAEIAATFGKMYAWARENHLAVDTFKVDIGYTFDGKESEHDLYVRIAE